MERFLVECAIRSALIALVTAAVLYAIRIKTAAARHTAWTSVLLTMLLLPLWTAWGPKTPIRLLPPVEWHANVGAQPVLAAPTRVTEMPQVNTFASRPPAQAQPRKWQNLLLIFYALGAFVLLARLAFGTARTHRLMRRANITDGRGVSSQCACPVTVGWLHPVVILPENWEQWPPQQLDAVLTHEREHVRRRDPLIQWLALMNRALFWFHPLAWWLERKLSALAEESCDAAVLARGHTPQNYSEYLLDIARSVLSSGSRLDIVGTAMPGSMLQQRIRQILNSSGAVPASRSRIVVAATIYATSSVVLAAGTLDHARARLQAGPSRLAHSSTLQTVVPETTVLPAASHAPEHPRVLVAQATKGTPQDPVASPAPNALAAASPDSAEKESQLENAFLRSEPITHMVIAMEINYFQLNRAEYFVPLTVKIPGSEVDLARNGGAERTTFDFIGEVKDTFGTTVQKVREKVSIDLKNARTSQAATPIEYDTGFKLLPGRYSIKFLARNNETNRIGTYETAFTIPNLNKEEQRIPISSVVLSSQRVESTDAINAANTMQAMNPLIADGRKLIPSVTRVFSKSREMYVYLQAYQREAGNTQPLFAFATFYQGQAKTLETAPIEVTQGMDPRSKAVPLSLNISLADLTPGEYTCQITVWSPIAQKTALWQAPVVIEP